jgi:hypothetical protein
MVWRHEHPVFIAELNRRQALWTEAHERLRALVGKAVNVLEQAVGDGDVKAAIELLKAVKLYGEVGATNGPTDPDVLVRQYAMAQLNREGVPRNDLDRLLTDLNSANYRARLAEVKAEIRTPYLDA